MMTHYLLIFFFLTSCQTGQNTISQRPIGAVQNNDGKKSTNIRPAPPPHEQQELFTRKKEAEITSDIKKNESGSLMNFHDSKNHFFAAHQDLNIGDFLTIQIQSNRVDVPAASPDDKKTPASAAVAGSAAPLPGADPAETAILNSFPNLEPGATKKPELLKNFQVQIIGIDNNGDLMVEYKRESTQDDYSNQLVLRGKISKSDLTPGVDPTTRNLHDITWDESKDGSLIDRRSRQWEDEYTLRLSQFDEAKSRSAITLENQKQQLKEIKSKLDTRLRTMSTERQKVAQQREELNRKAKENEEKVQKMHDDLEEKTKELESKEKELEKIKADKAKANLTALDTKITPGTPEPKAKKPEVKK